MGGGRVTYAIQIKVLSTFFPESISVKGRYSDFTHG